MTSPDRPAGPVARRLWRGGGIATLAVLLAPGAFLAPAQDPADAAAIRQVIRDASRALQAGNAPLFLASFDRRSFEGFDRLREQLAALGAQRRIASSVDSGAPFGGPAEWTVRVDWLLDLTPRLDPGPVERRRETITVGMRKLRGRWRIVSLEPRAFFSSAPQPAR